MVAAPSPIVAAETTQQSIIEDLRPEHPRLLATVDDFDELRTRIGTAEILGRWYAAVRAHADAILTEPVSVYEFPDGRSLLQVTRRVLDRSYTLGMAHRIDGDERHAEPLWAELAAAAEFSGLEPGKPSFYR